MSEERTSPPWLPLLAGAALVAFLGLLLGPERVLHVARGVARAPQAKDLLPAAGWSMLRMSASFAASLAFAWAAGYAAATRPRAARVILPLLDVGQSVPVLGFFPAAIYLFVTLLGGDERRDQRGGVGERARLVVEPEGLVVAAPDGDRRVMAEEVDELTRLAHSLLAHAARVAPLQRHVLPDEQAGLVGRVVELGPGDVGVDA